MGRQASINKLPIDVQNTLNERIRQSNYQALELQAIWLRGEGYIVSRSAVHRHSQALRAADSSLGDARARLAETKAKPRGTKDELLRELGRLQLEQMRIVARLEAMEDSGTGSGADANDDGE